MVWTRWRESKRMYERKRSLHSYVHYALGELRCCECCGALRQRGSPNGTIGRIRKLCSVKSYTSQLFLLVRGHRLYRLRNRPAIWKSIHELPYRHDNGVLGVAAGWPGYKRRKRSECRRIRKQHSSRDSLREPAGRCELRHWIYHHERNVVYLNSNPYGQFSACWMHQREQRHLRGRRDTCHGHDALWI